MIDCPIDGRKNITTSVCPQCKTDLSPLIYIRELPEKLYSEGISLLDNNMPGDAIKKFISALEEEPQNPKFLLALGKAYYSMGMTDEALKCISQVLEIDPGNEESARLDNEWKLSRDQRLKKEKEDQRKNWLISRLLIIVPVLTLLCGIIVSPLIIPPPSKIVDRVTVAKQGADAISDCGELIGYPITVSYSDSSFILSGTVPTLPHRALAAEIMKNVLAKDESTKNERINNSITIKPEQTFTSYIIRPGDNLGRIAGFFLGNSDLWPVITEYNKKIIPDPYHLKVGSSLKIPVNICR